MIKNIDDITLGDVIKLIDRKTGDHFKRWYNPFPVKWWFERREKLVREIYSRINEDKINGNDKEREERDEYLIRNKVLELDVSRHGIAIEMGFRPKALNILSWYKYKRKIKKPTPDAKVFIDKIHSITGIKIETDKDIIRVDKEIERRKDKLLELYPIKKDEPKGESISFRRLVAYTYAQTPQGYHDKVKLLDYLELRASIAEFNAAKAKNNAGDRTDSK
jgi:hypothetical protein